MTRWCARYVNANVGTYDSPLTKENDAIPWEYRVRRFAEGVNVTRSFGWATKNDFTFGAEMNLRQYRVPERPTAIRSPSRVLHGPTCRPATPGWGHSSSTAATPPISCGCSISRPWGSKKIFAWGTRFGYGSTPCQSRSAPRAHSSGRTARCNTPCRSATGWRAPRSRRR